MLCDFCGRAEMIELGCTVTHQALYWCPMCGTLTNCRGVTMTPLISQEQQHRLDALAEMMIGSDKPRRNGPGPR